MIYIHVCGLKSFQLTWAENQASFSDLIVSFVPPSVCKLFTFWTFLKLLGQIQPKHPYGKVNTNCIKRSVCIQSRENLGTVKKEVHFTKSSFHELLSQNQSKSGSEWYKFNIYMAFGTHIPSSERSPLSPLGHLSKAKVLLSMSKENPSCSLPLAAHC